MHVHIFQYYGHRTKLRQIGRENELEQMNRQALKLARQVADQTGTLMAGNICNNPAWDPNNPQAIEEVSDMQKVNSVICFV